MAKIINLDSRRTRNRLDLKSLKLLEVADALDKVILESLQSEMLEAQDVAGILAHRLGTLMRHMDRKSELWDVCERVLKRQAALD
jgi:hypothetical protein